MKITEVRIFPKKEDGDKKLRAFAAVTFNGAFVVRDIKIIEGGNGLFVAMPSRKAKEPCPKCGGRNAIHSYFCSQCGARLGTQQPSKRAAPEELTAARHIAHPITPECREHQQPHKAQKDTAA